MALTIGPIAHGMPTSLAQRIRPGVLEGRFPGGRLSAEAVR